MRMIYCEMLGTEVSFGYVFAINNTQHSDLLVKRTAYLAVSMFLDEDSELNLLSTHSIRKGLESTNYLENCAALTTLCTLVSAGTIPAFYPIVEKLIQHPKYMVRQKAVMALHRMWEKNHSAVDIQRVLRASLCDQKPSVMAAALCCFQDVLRTTIGESKKKTSFLLTSQDEETQTKLAKANTVLVPAFVQILWQIIEHRLPKSFDYHGVPAPWLQVHLLDILGLLGRDNESASGQIYDVLIGTLKAAAAVPNVASSAIVYECVRTATKLYPNAALLQLAGTVIDRFMVSKDNNMRSLGIKALGCIVRRYPAAVTPQHHASLIEALDSRDETIRRETLDLLFRMTNAKNVVAIAQKMMEQLKSTADTFLKKELVNRILQVSERFSPNPQWYLKTLFEVFRLGGAVINSEVAHHFTRMVSEDDSEEENGFKRSAAVILTEELHSAVVGDKVQTLPDVLVQCMAWVVGEYAPIAVPGPSGVETALLDLCDLFQHHQSKPETKLWVITAIGKLVARLGKCPPSVAAAVEEAKCSADLDVQQASYELTALAKYPQLLAVALPEDASWEEVEVDKSLAFLNAYTESKHCTRKYLPLSQRKPALERRRPAEASTPTLNFQYPTPEAAAKQAISSETLLASRTAGGAATASAAGGGKKNLWTAEGYAGGDSQPAEPEPEKSGADSLGDLLSGLAIAKDKAAKSSGVSPQSTLADDIAQTLKASQEPQRQKAKPRESEYVLKQKALAKEANDQKTKLAASLFAGLDDGAVATTPSSSQVGIGRRTKRQGATTATAAATTTTTVKQSSSSGMNLFDGLNSTAAPSSNPASSTPTPKKADLLDDLLGISPSPAVSATTSTPASAPAAQQNKSNDILDLLMGPSTPSTPSVASNTPSASTTAAATTTSANTLSSHQSLEEMLGIPASATNFSRMLRPGDLSFEAMTCSTAIATSVFPKISPRTRIATIYTGAGFALSSAAVPAGQSTLLVLFVANTGAAPLANVHLAFAPLPTVGVQSVAADMGVQLQQMTASIACVKPQEAAAVIFSVKFLGYAPSYGVVVRGSVAESVLPDVVAPLEVADAIRPLHFTTEQFGALWVRCACERRLRVRALQSVAESVQLICGRLNLHPVQVIGNECIMCGSVEGNASVPQTLCFVHFKFDANPNVGSFITIRTSDRNFTESLAKCCAELA